MEGANMTEFPRFDLTGQVSLVTGAARGLGRAISLALAHAGSNVALGLRDVSSAADLVREIQSMGRKALPLQMDVTRLDQISRAVQGTVDRFGRLDILVNNAGIAPENPAENYREEDFDLTLAVNLKGTFFASQAAGRFMIRQKSGRIINLGSQAGFAALPGESVYCMTKAAISHLTKCLAIEWGKHNITVKRRRAHLYLHTRHGRHARRPGLPRRCPRANCRLAPYWRSHGRCRRRGLPGFTRGLPDHRPHHPDRRRLDRPLTAILRPCATLKSGGGSKGMHFDLASSGGGWMPHVQVQSRKLELRGFCSSGEKYHRLPEKQLKENSRNSLAFGFEHGAVFDALHRLHLDFGLFVGHAFGGFRHHDQRLRAIAGIEGALELQRLDAALLAGVLLQRGLEHFRLRMQLVGDIRRQHGHHHRHGRFDFYADLRAVMVRREPAIHFQERRQLILLFNLLNPLILRLDAVFLAEPAEVMDMHIIGSVEMARGRTLVDRQHRRDALAHGTLGLVILVQNGAEPGEHRAISTIRTISFVMDEERHRFRRVETGISCIYHVLSRAQLL